MKVDCYRQLLFPKAYSTVLTITRNLACNANQVLPALDLVVSKPRRCLGVIFSILPVGDVPAVALISDWLKESART